jgi:hypothetical protein
VLAGDALACSCAGGLPIQERIDAADAAFVGRLLEVRGTTYVYDNDRTIKGVLGERVLVTSGRSEAQCGLRRSPADEEVGLLLTRAGAGWASSLCAQTTAGELLAVDDDPPGQAIRLVVGVVIIVAVLGYSVLRLRRRRAGRDAA